MAERLISPPFDTINGLPVTSESPRPRDGGFSIARDGSPITPELRAEYKEQAHLLVTPSEPETGVPLLYHPKGASKDVHLFPDDDHHPEHPSTHSLLVGYGAPAALRHSRTQHINYWLHHNDGHGTFRGPELPTTSEGYFQRIVYNAAGFIPEMAICFKEPGSYTLMPLSTDERLQLWNKKIVHIERPAAVHSYLKQYLFDQKLTTVRERDIDHFMHTTDPTERWKKAKNILDAAALEATDGMGETYKRFFDRLLLPPTNTWRVAKFVVSRLANHEGQKAVLSKELQSTLRTRYA